jgi:predicted Zn-ribbon and HTH transcriptional regulator
MHHQTKQCLKCKKVKPLSHFGSNSNAPDGLNCYCKPCAAQKSRENRTLMSLKRRLSANETICARCGAKSRLSTLWLVGYMLPVTVCKNCYKAYLLYPAQIELVDNSDDPAYSSLEPLDDIAQIPIKVMTIDEFYHWLREKKCLNCGHKWLAQSPEPLRCPNCKSHRWQEEEEITNE